MNREDWLNIVTEKLRPRLAEAGAPLPEVVRVTCGWPSAMGTSLLRPRIGECWKAESSEGKHPEIFISPTLSDGVTAAAVVLHELIHAAKPEAKHGAGFKRVALALGLEGKMTATVPSLALAMSLHELVTEIGPYPHERLTPMLEAKKQSTRLLKVECPSCGYVARITSKWVEVGCPTCPCGELMAATDTEEAA